MVLALKLYTLGGLRVSIGDQLVPDLGTRKAEVLLVYLCTQKRPIAREILAEMFWEERAQRRALSNLRVALAALRKALGDYLLVERDTAAVDPQVEVWLDAAQLETQLKSVGTAGELHTKEEAAALAAALDLYRGAFLEGIYLREARAAEEWLEGEREHLARLAVEGLSALVAFHLGQQDYAAGIRFAERLLALDPLNEAAHRWMMRLLLGAGRRSAALAQYEVCRELLEQARLCMDQQERIKFYQAADRILMDDAVYIPLFYMLDHWLVRPWVRNWDFWNLRGVILEPH